MKPSRRLILLLLAAAMLIGLTACGKTPAGQSAPSGAVFQSAEASVPTANLPAVLDYTFGYVSTKKYDLTAGTIHYIQVEQSGASETQ